MTQEQFIGVLENEVFDIESGTINMDTVLDEIEEWDSMAKIALNAVLDTNFQVTFNSTELSELNKVSDIIEKIQNSLE